MQAFKIVQIVEDARAEAGDDNGVGPFLLDVLFDHGPAVRCGQFVTGPADGGLVFLHNDFGQCFYIEDIRDAMSGVNVNRKFLIH